MADKPGIRARLAAAAKLIATGRVDRTTFFGPLEPLAPQAPEEVKGRLRDYRAGENLIVTPRGESRIDFQELRALADNYDVLRLVIEHRKDQIAMQEWVIQARDPKKRGAADARVRQLTDFFKVPDGDHAWASWIKLLLEDMEVIDAATIYPRFGRGGDLIALDIVDGATIKPVIDDHGRRPRPPLPAYQQVLKGLPAVDYTAAQLIYAPRTPRSDRLYGFPPVEQIIMTVNIALRREMHQLEYYTAGTMPDALIGVPDTWAPQQIEEFQAYFDALLTDNTAERRKVRFVPAGLSKGFVQTKEAALKDLYDEWLARVVCYAFALPPTPFIKEMTRATAGTANEQSDREGLTPRLIWVKWVMDRIIREVFGYPDIEFSWREEEDTDPDVQMQIAIGYLKVGAITIDEVRADLGRDPLPNGLGAAPLVYGTAGAVTVESVVHPPAAAAPGVGHNGGPALEGDPKDPGGTGSASQKPEISPAERDRTPGRPDDLKKIGLTGIQRDMAFLNGVYGQGLGSEGAPTQNLAKNLDQTGNIEAEEGSPFDRLARQRAKRDLDRVWRAGLRHAGERIAAAVRDGDRHERLAKADGGSGDGAEDAGASALAIADENRRTQAERRLGEATGAALAALREETEKRSADILGRLRADAESLGTAETAHAPGIEAGIDESGGVIDITHTPNPNAIAWAEDRAAALVSEIDGATRTMLRDLIVKSQKEGWGVADLAREIEGATAFSEKRAMRIAHYETRNADNQGRLASWRRMAALGARIKKRWIPYGTHVCPACIANETDGAIPLEEPFTSGAMTVPGHINCECGVVPVVGAKT